MSVICTVSYDFILCNDKSMKLIKVSILSIKYTSMSLPLGSRKIEFEYTGRKTVRN